MKEADLCRRRMRPSSSPSEHAQAYRQRPPGWWVARPMRLRPVPLMSGEATTSRRPSEATSWRAFTRSVDRVFARGRLDPCLLLPLGHQAHRLRQDPLATARRDEPPEGPDEGMGHVESSLLGKPRPEAAAQVHRGRSWTWAASCAPSSPRMTPTGSRRSSGSKRDSAPTSRVQARAPTSKRLPLSRRLDRRRRATGSGSPEGGRGPRRRVAS